MLRQGVCFCFVLFLFWQKEAFLVFTSDRIWRINRLFFYFSTIELSLILTVF